MTARLTSIGCILLGGFLYWTALGSDHPLAYFFPQVLGLLMLGLGVGMFIMELGKNRKPSGRINIPWARLWPGMLVLIVYMAIAQRAGFYLSSWLAFVSLGILYAPGRGGLAMVKRCVPISVTFLAVLYVVFWTLLRVQMPRGFAF